MKQFTEVWGKGGGVKDEFQRKCRKETIVDHYYLALR